MQIKCPAQNEEEANGSPQRLPALIPYQLYSGSGASAPKHSSVQALGGLSAQALDTLGARELATCCPSQDVEEANGFSQ